MQTVTHFGGVLYELFWSDTTFAWLCFSAMACLFGASITFARDVRAWLAALQPGDFSAPRVGNNATKLKTVRRQLKKAREFAQAKWRQVWLQVALFAFFGVIVPTGMLVGFTVFYPMLIANGSAILMHSGTCAGAPVSTVSLGHVIGLIVQSLITEDGANFFANAMARQFDFQHRL